MYRQTWNAPTNQYLFILYIRNECHFEGYTGLHKFSILSVLGVMINWNCLRKDFEVFQPAYEPLNMDTYIGNARSVGGVFFRELHASLGEC